MSIWGNAVTLGGAGGDIPIIPYSQWEAMTPEQKESYGLVGLTTTETGYFRGYLVNGVNYSLSLLDLSDAPFISLEELWHTYIEGTATWGSFVTHGTGITRDDTDDCLLLENSTWLTADVLGDGNFTIYGVVRRVSTVNNSRALLSINRNTTQHSYLGSSRTSTEFFSTNNSYSNISGVYCTDWHVYAIAANIENNNIRVFVDGEKKVTPTVNGMICEMFSVSAHADGTLWQKTAIKYCAVVQKADSDELIAANTGKIMDYFGLGA